jgi:hypothetical protein
MLSETDKKRVKQAHSIDVFGIDEDEVEQIKNGEYKFTEIGDTVGAVFSRDYYGNFRKVFEASTEELDMGTEVPKGVEDYSFAFGVTSTDLDNIKEGAVLVFSDEVDAQNNTVCAVAIVCLAKDVDEVSAEARELVDK